MTSPPQPETVARVRVVRWGDLSSAERDTLIRNTARIYAHTFEPGDLDHYARAHFPTPATRVALFSSASGELLGFCHVTLLPFCFEGRDQAVFSAGVFFLPGVGGGIWAGAFGLFQALRFKLRHPRTPLAYMSLCSSPAPYRLQASVMPRMYPRRGVETPPRIERMVRAVLELRGTPCVEGRVPLVRSPNPPRSRPKAEQERVRDGHERYYHAVNPGYRETGDVAVVTWLPLTTPNIFGALARVAWRLARRSLRRLVARARNEDNHDGRTGQPGLP